MKRTLLLAQFSLLLAGCSSTGIGTSDLDKLHAQREQWEAQQPTAYEYVLQRYCMCIPLSLRISVHEGQIHSVVDTQTDEPVAVDADQVKSIEDLFVLLEEGLHEAFRVVAEYDDAFGYPTSVHIDLDPNIVDEEISYTVGELQAVN